MRKIRLPMGDDLQVTQFRSVVVSAISKATGGLSDTLLAARMLATQGKYEEAGDRLLSRGERELYDLKHAFGGTDAEWMEWYETYRDRSGFGNPTVVALVEGQKLKHLEFKR